MNLPGKENSQKVHDVHMHGRVPQPMACFPIKSMHMLELKEGRISCACLGGVGRAVQANIIQTILMADGGVSWRLGAFNGDKQLE